MTPHQQRQTVKMESKWYLFPGQTFENTKISDRAHALHITSHSWNNITQHLERKKRQQEAIDRERAHRDALKQGSEAMTKNWDDSIQNLRLRKEQERRDRLSKKHEDKIQLFYKMRKEQDAIRKEYIEKVKKEAFVSTGYPKNLTSALILSETLYEQERQKEFNQQLREQQKEAKKVFDQNILDTDTRQQKEDQETKLKEREKAQKNAEILQEQIREYEETQRADNRERLEREKLDRYHAETEFELIKEYEHKEKIRKQTELREEIKRTLRENQETRATANNANVEVEKAAKFYEVAKYRMKCLMKLKEQTLREQGIKEREKLAEKLAIIAKAKDAEENAKIEKALAEGEAREKAKLEAKAVKLAAAKQERIEDRKQYLKRLETEKHIEKEVDRWEVLNRRKIDETMKEYNEQHKNDKKIKMEEYKKELLEQMDDDKERVKREKEIDDLLTRASYEEDDKMFFEYAKEVLDLAKSKNRTTYPIERVIAEYKKINRLVSKSRQCRCCKK